MGETLGAFGYRGFFFARCNQASGVFRLAAMTTIATMTKEDWEDLLVRSASNLDAALHAPHGRSLNLYGLAAFIDNAQRHFERVNILAELQAIPFETIQKLVSGFGPGMLTAQLSDDIHPVDQIGHNKEFTETLNALIPASMRVEIVPEHAPNGRDGLPARLPPEDFEPPEERERAAARRIVRQFTDMMTQRLSARFAELSPAASQEMMVAACDRVIGTLFGEG